MKPYTYLPHTADTKFQAFGKTLEEAFGNAALAVANVMVDTKNVEAGVEKTITAAGNDLEDLLQQFLEQFLILLDSENFILKEVKNITISGMKLRATAIGDDVSRYETHGPQVKAISYHDMKIEQKKEEVVVQVVVDI